MSQSPRKGTQKPTQYIPLSDLGGGEPHWESFVQIKMWGAEKTRPKKKKNNYDRPSTSMTITYALKLTFLLISFFFLVKYE